MKKFLVFLALAACKPAPTPSPEPSPSPGPQTSLRVELPIMVRIQKGDDVVLRVAPQDGVSYTWSTGDTGGEITVRPAAATVYTVTGVRGAEKAQAAVTVVPQ